MQMHWILEVKDGKQIYHFFAFAIRECFGDIQSDWAFSSTRSYKLKAIFNDNKIEKLIYRNFLPLYKSLHRYQVDNVTLSYNYQL